MRIRYFYQQLISFLIVIVLTVALVGGCTLGFAKRVVNQQVEDQLQSVSSYVTEDIDVSPSYVNTISPVLNRWNAAVAMADENGNRIYPYEDEGQPDEQVSDNERNQLANGQSIGLRHYKMRLSDESEEDDYLSIIEPMVSESSGQYVGYIAIGVSVSQMNQYLNQFKRRVFLGMLVAVIVALLLAVYLSYRQTSRINRLIEGNHQIAQGNYSHRIPVDRVYDEIDQLSVDFNHTAEALEKSHAEVERQENLRGQMMMDVAHEMRTPLTTMNGLLEGLANHIIPEERVDQSIQLLQNETQRLIRLVNNNLDYEKIRANEIHLEKMQFPVKPVFDDIALQLHDEAEEKEDHILVEVEEGTTVYADRDRFRQIIFNITQNGVQFTESGTIEMRAQMNEENQTVIRIKDSGMGMTKEEVENIWERFYKADESRKSSEYGESGLGLSIVKQLVLAHGATIDVDSSKGVGTIFTIVFEPQTDEEKQELQVVKEDDDEDTKGQESGESKDT